MLAEAHPEIKYIAVGRMMDKNLVATLSKNADNKVETQELYEAAMAVMNTPDFSRKVLPGAYHSLAGDVNVIHFTVDGDANRVFLVIASKEYPKRVVLELVSKLVQQFLAEFASPSMTCARNGLSARAKPMFSTLLEEFSDLSRKDTLFKVAQQVKEATTNKTEENVLQMLDNIAAGRDLEQQSIDLHGAEPEHAVVDANKQERCRQYQSYALVLSVIVIIIFLIVTRATATGVPSTLAPTSM